jgi:hypothetical protein
LSRAVVQFGGGLVEFTLRDRLEVGAAGEVLAQQAVRVLVGAALPRAAARRLEATARAALANGDAEGAYAAAYDAYPMAAEALLARQRLRATGGDGSHMCGEDAVCAQFSADILAFAKPAFERLRRTRHTAQYFDPAAAPVTESDAAWAIAKAAAAVSGVRALLQAGSLDQFG